MGEARDESGKFLGSASGATKLEVFEKLNAMFPNAAVISIRTKGETAIGEATKASPLDVLRDSFAPDEFLSPRSFRHLRP